MASSASPPLARLPPATVVSAGLMHKTVKVRMVKQEWNRKLRKVPFPPPPTSSTPSHTPQYFQRPSHALVRDPNSSLRTGDVIRLAPERHSTHVRHVVASLIAAFGPPASDRPPILSAEQRVALAAQKNEAATLRRARRGVPAAIEAAKYKGWWDAAAEGEAPAPASNRTDLAGRESLPGGGHKFGKINEEARRAGQRVRKLREKGVQAEAEVEEQAARRTEDVAQLQLEKESGRVVERTEAR